VVGPASATSERPPDASSRAASSDGWPQTKLPCRAQQRHPTFKRQAVALRCGLSSRRKTVTTVQTTHERDADHQVLGNRVGRETKAERRRTRSKGRRPPFRIRPVSRVADVMGAAVYMCSSREEGRHSPCYGGGLRANRRTRQGCLVGRGTRRLKPRPSGLHTIGCPSWRSRSTAQFSCPPLVARSRGGLRCGRLLLGLSFSSRS
jgi:hypothetical protein